MSETSIEGPGAAGDGDVFEVSIDGLGTAGDGVGRLESGQVVFVPGALPGDRVEIRFTRRVKRVQHAEIVRLLEPSSERVDSRCGVKDCGGCPVRSFSASGQAGAKQARVVQALQRIAGQDVTELLSPLVQAGDGWRYRHRVRLHAAWRGDRWRLGYFARRTSRLVPLAGCPVLCPELEAAAIALDRSLRPLPRQAGPREVDLACSRLDGRSAARMQVAQVAAFRESPEWFESSGLSGVEVCGPDESWQRGYSELRYDHARASEFDLLFEPGVFTQANTAVNDAIVETVLGALRASESPRVLELHAGVGNFSLPLALAGAEVFAVEHMQRAVLLAQRNAERAGTSLHAFVLEDIEALVDSDPVPPLSTFDAVLLDPPRIGAHAVARLLAESGPKRVVYVSCDPATLARDVKELAAGGYRIGEVSAFDMFPQTPHVEAVVRMERE